MLTFLDTIGPAIWRASWQATVLAVGVALLLRCCGERLAPRWRFLLWTVVLVRLLCVVTPGSPWSIFNVTQMQSAAEAQVDTDSALPARPTVQSVPSAMQTPTTESAASPVPQPNVSRPNVVRSSHLASPPSRSLLPAFDLTFLVRMLTSLWFVGCLWLGVKLLMIGWLLRRRLSACRLVTDPALLELLKTCSQRMGVRRVPRLLVTPESHSPCVVGTWNSQIILPESLVTEFSAGRFRHVLAHELAHLVRGDLWTNWLLLAARTVHWFNPVAWWTVRELQAEREAACDELAFAALGEVDRAAYASTIVELAASLAPSALAPGFIGFFSSNHRLQSRVERLLRFPLIKKLYAPIGILLVLCIALLGLTDAMPQVRAQAPAAAPVAAKVDSKTYTINAICVDHASHKPMAGVTVRLYQSEGEAKPPQEIARTVTGADGRYTFTGLVPPSEYNDLKPLRYASLGFAEGRPIGKTFHHFSKDKEVVELRIPSEKSTISGKVVDGSGRPIAGATVASHWIDRLPFPGLFTTKTDDAGRFKFDDVGVYKTPDGKFWSNSIAVFHPDYPDGKAQVTSLPAEVTVKLTAGAIITGSVLDGVTGKPGSGATVKAQRLDEFERTYSVVDAEGKFRLVVPEGEYDFSVEAPDRVCVTSTGHECQVGRPVALPQFQLIAGGFISGKVINTATKQVVPLSERGDPIAVGYYGPSQAAGRVTSPMRLGIVDKEGRFTMRAAPGNNYPYFVNMHGDRMAWDTLKLEPVVVKAGETTNYDMLITPKASPAEKLAAARKVIAGLSVQPTERTAQIIEEFRKLSKTVDETELWCSLMRELVAIGPAAVPQLIAELDQTTVDRHIRRLVFAMRAIGDARAVPALIRCLPKLLMPISSDYGLIVEDKELTAFMQLHDLDGKSGGTYFSVGRPVRELIATLHKLTGQNFDDSDLFQIGRSEDPRRQVLQRRFFVRQARRWQAWWDQNAPKVTADPAYQKTNLQVADEPLPGAPASLGKTAHIQEEWQGAVVCPPIQEGQHAWNFYDLDTGYAPKWPSEIPRDKAALDPTLLDRWAKERGIDLMCVTHRAADGTETFVLRTVGMTVQEISERDRRNLAKTLASGMLPEGRPVGELLMHFDEASQQLLPNANGTFLFVTSEGNRGYIETTDRITQTANLTGLAGGAPAGVGFHKGVQFNLRQIIP